MRGRPWLLCVIPAVLALAGPAGSETKALSREFTALNLGPESPASPPTDVFSRAFTARNLGPPRPPEGITAAFSRAFTVAVPQENGIALTVRVYAPTHVSPGQEFTYLVEYSNLGSIPATGVIVFVSLPDSVRVTSTSPITSVNEASNVVEFSVGTVLPATTLYVSIGARAVWGLPNGMSLSAVAAITVLDTSSSPTGPLPNVFVNGIANCSTTVMHAKYREFADLRNANWVESYPSCNPAGFGLNLLDVIAASNNIATSTNGLLELSSASYDTCWGYSGGTVSIISAIRNRGLSCNHVILVSPFLTTSAQLEELLDLYGVQDITIWQSPDDLVPWPQSPQFKVPLGDPLRNRVDVRDVLGIQHAGDTGWMSCLNLGQVMSGNVNQCFPGDGSFWKLVAFVLAARDPNSKEVDRSVASPGDTLHFTVRFENEGAGIAYGVYVTDGLDDDLDAATLSLPGPEGGSYDPGSRTIRWNIGELQPSQHGERHFSVRVKSGVPCGSDVTNFATVVFPSVPEVTPTNGVSVAITGPGCDRDGDGVLDGADNCPTIANGDQADADGDGIGNVCDADADNDGMPNAYEELYACLDPLVNDAGQDPDGDGLTNLQEFGMGSPFTREPDPCVYTVGVPPRARLDLPDALLPTMPNPAGLTTLVRFTLAGSRAVELDLFDVRGGRVRRLASGWRPAGLHEIRWNGADDAGRLLPAGVYFLRLKAGGFVGRGRIVVVR